MPDLSASFVEAAILFVGGVLCVLLGFRKVGNDLASTRLKNFQQWAGPGLIGYAVVSLIRGRSESIDLETVAHEVRSKINPPVQIDEDTRLDDIRTVSNTELGYFLTLVKVTKSQFDANPIRTQFESNLTADACQNPDYSPFFKSGFTLSFTVRTQDQAEVARVVLTGKDCGH